MSGQARPRRRRAADLLWWLAMAVLALAAPVTLALSGGSHGSRAAAPNGVRDVSPGRSPAPVAADPQVRSVAGRLSAEQLAGQRIVYAYTGLTPPESLLGAIRAGEAAGVIFFGSNIASAAQLRAVVRELQQARLAGPVRAPLLMLVDQEGGQVRRLPGAPVLSAKEVAASSDPLAAARAAGAGAAGTLRAAGINVNLAPVLDVYRQPGNFIDRYHRSFSSSPALAGRLGAAFIAAQQQLGVAATAKHFPGLGAADADQDTDARPVTLLVGAAQLRDIDEAPYRAAIAAGAKLVMTSWAIYPALDPARPAGLSRSVVQGELRERLGFRGVTITDALAAGATAPYGTIGQRAVEAAGAGDDLILCVTATAGQNSPAVGDQARDAMAAALQAGTLDRAGALRSVERILALRHAL